MMNPGNHLLLNRSLPNFRNIEKKLTMFVGYGKETQM